MTFTLLKHDRTSYESIRALRRCTFLFLVLMRVHITLLRWHFWFGRGLPCEPVQLLLSQRQQCKAMGLSCCARPSCWGLRLGQSVPSCGCVPADCLDPFLIWSQDADAVWTRPFLMHRCCVCVPWFYELSWKVWLVLLTIFGELVELARLDVRTWTTIF